MLTTNFTIVTASNVVFFNYPKPSLLILRIKSRSLIRPMGDKLATNSRDMNKGLCTLSLDKRDSETSRTIETSNY